MFLKCSVEFQVSSCIGGEEFFFLRSVKLKYFSLIKHYSSNRINFLLKDFFKFLFSNCACKYWPEIP